MDADADAGGALYVVGVTDGAFPGGGGDPGERDVFLRKLSPAGAHVWTRQFGSDDADFPDTIDVTGRGIAYVGGATLGELPGQTQVGGHDGFVASYGPGGGSRWMIQFGSVESDGVRGISARRTDEVTVGGDTEGDLARPHEGGGDGFVRRYAPPS